MVVEAAHDAADRVLDQRLLRYGLHVRVANVPDDGGEGRDLGRAPEIAALEEQDERAHPEHQPGRHAHDETQEGEGAQQHAGPGQAPGAWNAASSAAMCSGVVPQQPPTSRAPSRTQSRACRAKSSGATSASFRQFGGSNSPISG